MGIPGMGDEMEGAMQHAPQPSRHSFVLLCTSRVVVLSLILFGTIVFYRAPSVRSAYGLVLVARRSKAA